MPSVEKDATIHPLAPVIGKWVAQSAARKSYDVPALIEQIEAPLADYLLEGDQGHLELIHEPCGESLLVTLHVHLDTLTRLAREHECSGPSGGPDA